jgi:tRNA (cytidine/uridine-2'-O-)-methyltransferase
LGDEKTPPVRLRAPGTPIPFRVVLVNPEIPPNTGNIARLCAATRTELHLVGKLGFSIDEHAVRRAGVDTWHMVQVRHHADLEAAEGCIAEAGSTSSWLLSGKASRSIYDCSFQCGDTLIFGRESTGLPQDLLEKRAARVVGIPTVGPVRSLNLANSVAVVLYEALRQVGGLAGATKR